MFYWHIAFNWPIAREKTDLISLRSTAFVTICYAVWFKTNSDFIKKKTNFKILRKNFFLKTYFEKFVKTLKNTTTFDVFERHHYEILPLDKLKNWLEYYRDKLLFAEN